MDYSLLFFLNSFFLGVGLAMDAFSVSIVNGINNTGITYKKALGMAGIFAVFQAIMPITGWFFVNTLINYFTVLTKTVPWISLILLCFIGIKMIIDGCRNKTGAEIKASELSFPALLIQGLATSLDALSVGLTLAGYNAVSAVTSSVIIGTVTFLICFAGVLIGKKAGNKLIGNSSVFGGCILIAIGIEIFIKGII